MTRKFDTKYWLKCLRDPGWVGTPLVNKQMAEHFEEMAERDKSREGADHYGPYGANCMYTGQFDAGECWLCYAKRKKQEAAEMQLAAGRYQYLFEHAMKFINNVDDLFEYRYKSHSEESLKEIVRTNLAIFTEAAAKIKGG